jgi:uncharacterized protein DUF3606
MEMKIMASGVAADRVVSAGRVPGRDRINTGREFEVRYWTARLGCTAEELRAAIRVVGNSIARVRAYVASRRRGRAPLIHLREVLGS